MQSFDYIETRKKVHSRIEITGPFSEFLATSLILSVMVYVSYEVASGRSTAGTLIAYIGSIMTLSPAIKKIQENMVRIQELRASAKRVYDILDDHREVPKALQPVPFPSSWNEIQFKNISFSYGDRPILKDVSLTIRRGEKIALVGESGSGKSTILNLMERFYDPQKGSVMIDNVSIDQFELQDLRNQMALVSQDVSLFRDSVAENITVTKPEATTEQIREAALRANAEIFIQRLENKYETKVGDRGGLLSGGEKQRISIARAILKNADILLLDEATSALDSESEKEVQKSLDEAIVGKTSIIVSHRLSTIQNVDRIYVMSHGQIVESGRHQELVDKKGIYFKLWTIQSMN